MNLNEQFESDTSDAAALDAEIKSSQAALESAASKLERAVSFRTLLRKTGGISRSLAIEGMKIDPNFNGTKPLGYYTDLATATQYRPALESSDRTILQRIGDMIQAVISFLGGLIKRIFGMRDEAPSKEEVKAAVDNIDAAAREDAVWDVFESTAMPTQKAAADVAAGKVKEKMRAAAKLAEDATIVVKAASEGKDVPQGTLDKLEERAEALGGGAPHPQGSSKSSTDAHHETSEAYGRTVEAQGRMSESLTSTVELMGHVSNVFGENIEAQKRSAAKISEGLATLDAMRQADKVEDATRRAKAAKVASVVTGKAAKVFKDCEDVIATVVKAASKKRTKDLKKARDSKRAGF